MDQAGGRHRGNPILRAGKSLEEAEAAMVMLHGRGASARDILALSEELPNDKFAYLAPQAANFTWYPYSFLAPIERNEPWLSSALALLKEKRDPADLAIAVAALRRSQIRLKVARRRRADLPQP